MNTTRTLVGFFLVATVGFASILPAQDAGDAIVDGIRSQLKDPSKPFTLVVKIRAKEGASQQLEAAFAEAIPPTRKEHGCLRYELNRSMKTAGEYIVYERWASLEDIKKHIKAPTITKLMEKLSAVSEGQPDFTVLVPAAE